MHRKVKIIHWVEEAPGSLGKVDIYESTLGTPPAGSMRDATPTRTPLLDSIKKAKL